MPIRCIIVEDEPLAMERLKGFVQQMPELQLIGAFDGGIEAWQFIKSNRVDLIFLDINMDGLSGIQLLENMQFKGDVIITTAYNEFALKGYELNVTDYLLKPFSFDRFLKAIDKVETPNLIDNHTRIKEYIFVKTEYRLEKVVLQDVLFIEGMRDYRRIHTTSNRIMTLQNFKDFESEIPPSIICRVHKSFMVAIGKIESIERDRIRIKDQLIPISDTYKEQFHAIIGNKFKR